MQMMAHAVLSMHEGSAVSLLAFKYENELSQLYVSWGRKQVTINYNDLSQSSIEDDAGDDQDRPTITVHVQTISPMLDQSHPDYYPALGLAALQATKAPVVISLGGGSAAEREFLLCRERLLGPVRWYFVPIARKRSEEGNGLYQSSDLVKYLVEGHHLSQSESQSRSLNQLSFNESGIEWR